MNLYQAGHEDPIAPNMLWHYFKDGVKLEVAFFEGVEVTINVILPAVTPGYPNNERYSFVADKKMKVCELHERVWRLMKGVGLFVNPTNVHFNRITIGENEMWPDWDLDHPIGNYMVGLGSAPELEIWVSRG